MGLPKAYDVSFEEIIWTLPSKAVYLHSLQYREVEQLVARWAHNPKVAGSSPVLATNKVLKAA